MNENGHTMADKTRRCKDCPPTSKRPAPFPGPRCATHDRERKKAVRQAGREARQRKNFGLSWEDREKVNQEQAGLCAICGPWTGYNGRTRALSTDHDHKTLIIRGLLCKHCNDMLGRAGDDPAMFERAAEYLRNPPAVKVLGVRYAPTPGDETRRADAVQQVDLLAALGQMRHDYEDAARESSRPPQ